MTERNMPTVSIMVPSYNARHFVARAIDSALAQTVRDVEVIVVDDASRDGTAGEVLQRYGDEPRVRVIRLEQNGGPARARNTALAAARGAWIAPLDADDAWKPQRLERLLAHAHDADAVFDNLAAYDPAAQTEGGALFPEFPEQTLTLRALLAPQARGTTYDLGYLKPMMRREFLRARGLRYDDTLRTGEDLLLYVTLMLEGARTTVFDEALYLYTLPVDAAGNASASSHTRPRDRDMRRALEGVLAAFGDDIEKGAKQLLEQRIAFLRHIAPISDFYFARRRRSYGHMAYLLARHPSVQREALRKIWAILPR